MTKISKIEQQKKRLKRYNVFLEGDFWLGIHQSLIQKWNLVVGSELSENKVQLIYKEQMGLNAREKAFSYIGYKDRTTQEVKTKLIQLDFDTDTVEQVILKLNEDGFLDDRQYAKNYVEQRKNRYGRHRIFLDLKKRGVSNFHIEEALKSEFSKEEGRQNALELTLKKKKNFEQTGISSEKMKKRIGDTLYRKGYDFETIRWAMEEADLFFY